MANFLLWLGAYISYCVVEGLGFCRNKEQMGEGKFEAWGFT